MEKREEPKAPVYAIKKRGMESFNYTRLTTDFLLKRHKNIS
jgi:hypothetical protein